MIRPVALGVLGIFAVLFLAAAWWGWSDLGGWRTAIATCTTPLIIDGRKLNAG